MQFDGTEPIDDDELLYRRVPASQGWYADGSLSPEAFRPNEHDTTGLSIFRARHTSIEAAAKGRPGRQYFVAILNAGDLRRHGIVASPVPRPESPGHAEIPGLNYANRKSDQALQWKVLMAKKLTRKVVGPFG